MEKPESEMSPRERAFQEDILKALRGGGKLPADKLSEEARRLSRDPYSKNSSNSPQLIPSPSMSFVKLKENGQEGWTAKILTQSLQREMTVPSLSLLGLDKLYDAVPKEDLIVFAGSIPEFAREWISNCKRCVIYSRRSRAVHLSDLRAAALLASRPINPADTIVFNALPFEKETDRSSNELARMEVAHDQAGWLKANDQITASAKGVGLTVDRAEKSKLIHELQDGNRNVIFIIAHSDSQFLYLPGQDGARVSLEELRSLRRQEAPDRIVVLMVCEGGNVNERAVSVGEILLQNNLAKTVLATPSLVDARGIAGMLRLFRDPSTSPRSAFPNLWQMVVEPGLKRFPAG